MNIKKTISLNLFSYPFYPFVPFRLRMITCLPATVSFGILFKISYVISGWFLKIFLIFDTSIYIGICRILVKENYENWKSNLKDSTHEKTMRKFMDEYRELTLKGNRRNHPSEKGTGHERPHKETENLPGGSHAGRRRIPYREREDGLPGRTGLPR